MSTAPYPRRRLPAAIAAAACVAVLLAGCTGSATPDPTSPAAPTSTAPSSESPTTDEPTASDEPAPSDTATATPVAPDAETPLPADDPTADVPFPADQRPDTAKASDDAALSPTGFRVGAHDGFDRVVMDFAGPGTPGWNAHYTDAPTSQGSGLPVDVQGATTLMLEIDGVTIPTADGAAPWAGPENLMPKATGTVAQVYRGALFEGVQEVFLGVRAAQPFRVYALTNPTRVVVDIYSAPNAADQPALPADDPKTAAPFAANRKPDTQKASNSARLSPLDMRLAVHKGFDRIVLDMVGVGAPGWHGQYVTKPAHAGSGDPVSIRGKSTLQVSVRGVVYPTEPGAAAYKGLDRVQPRDGGIVEEVVYGYIFEGQLELYVGLKSEQPFRVFRLANPARVVIDVQHP